MLASAATPFGTGGKLCNGTTKLCNPLGGISSIDALLNALVNVLLQIGVPIAALAIIYSGLLYVMARGDSKKITEAHNVFYYTIIGTAILLGAFVISAVIRGTIAQIAQ